VTNYQYNGLGDRLSQNGTQYTLDLNAGLTQVLDDGTTSYTYGLGRISQKRGNTTEYFHGDALGSVRQLTDQNGQLTLAKSYDPYGAITQSSGASHTDYGFTGESYGDSTQLIYLRARFYNPSDGRFQSRDTWSGNVNRPMSMNRWMYVEGNPVNRIDPSGNMVPWCWPSTGERANLAEKYVARKYSRNVINTYTAAGIGVQCYGGDWPYSNAYQGVGIAQVSERQIEEEYGKKVYHLGKDGKPDEPDPNKKGAFVIRGYGLRCWINIQRGCTICKTRDELTADLKDGQDFNDVYKLEDTHDPQKDTGMAVEYMKRRIKQVIGKCVGCTETDKFIAAALGQNGPGLNPKDMENLSTWGIANPFRDHKDAPIEWEKYFGQRMKSDPANGHFDTVEQLNIFSDVAWELQNRSPNGWYIPPLDMQLIYKLRGL
jgi:RHS repeat-associated protein